MNHVLTKSMKSQQFNLLSNQLGLYELFNKIQMRPVFNIPENSILVNLENITFGPDKYSIIVRDMDDIYIKVIYYSILYFAFQKNRDNKGHKVYQKLLAYVLRHNITLNLLELSLSQEEVKVYIFKFLNILASTQKKNKIVFEELSNLPQINLILVELFKDICGYQDINIENNAKIIEQNLLEQLGVKIQLLSYEMFIIQDEFIVQMRMFRQYFEFAIVTQKNENVERIRNQFLLAQSACFNMQMSGSNMLKAQKKSNIIKKSTLKSVQWVEEEQNHEDINDPEVESKDLINALTSIKNIKQQNYIKKPSKQSTQDEFDNPFKRFDKVLNMRELVSNEMNNSSIIFNMNQDDDRFFQTVPLENDNPFDFSKTNIKYHKTSLQIKNPFLSKENYSELKNSLSTKCLKSDGFSTKGFKTKRNLIKIPTFIKQRMKQKQCLKATTNLNQNLNKSVHEIKLGGSPFYSPIKTVKIIFTYQS